MQDPHVLFDDYAAKQRLKMTPQRRHILDVFLEQSGHVTSEELYELVKKAYKTIGQATVYRTLKLLSGAGIAKEVDFGDGVTRYELQQGDDHHDHLICEGCGENVEVLDEEIEKLQEQVAARHGYRLTRHKMYLYGICPKCQGKKKG
ncbi:MAG: Fur family transcriptional regulator [Acidobacteriota bacterium]